MVDDRYPHLLRCALGWLVAALLLVAPGPSARADSSGFAGPEGWQTLCTQAPSYCNREAPAPGEVLDAAALHELERINSAVNSAIVPQLEPEGRDRWEIEPAAGDCEDYALTKKHRLLATGWPRERLRFATVTTESDEYHAVLFVDGPSGPLVLDNRFEEALPWERLEAEGYRLIAVEGAGPDGSWRLSTFGTVLAMLVGEERRGDRGRRGG